MTKADHTPADTGGQTIPYDVSGVSGTRVWGEPASEPDDLPLMTVLRGWLSAYADNPERQRALMAERGIRPATGRRFEIMWSAWARAWVLPVRDQTGGLVNLTYRPPRHHKDRKPWRVKGRLAVNGGLPLYPAIPAGPTWLLCAGDWDALAAIQAGLPAVTGLCGYKWLDAWDQHARGKRVAVLYDRGKEEEKGAKDTVERLRKAGASEAWMVKWPSSFPVGYDVGDWFLEGRTRDDLVKLIRRQAP